MLSPYLSFTGNCEEAFACYGEVFSGHMIHMSRYADMPNDPANPLSDDIGRQVMHVVLSLPGLGSISGADSLAPVESGSAVALHADMPAAHDAERVFAALSAGGRVISPLATNPPPDDRGVSGALVDRYGFTWIISALKD